MKVIPRSEFELNWWVGGRVQCECCGSTMELENGDRVIEYRIGTTMQHVKFACQCGESLVIFKDKSWDNFDSCLI